MVVLGGGRFLMSEVPLDVGSYDLLGVDCDPPRHLRDQKTPTPYRGTSLIGNSPPPPRNTIGP